MATDTPDRPIEIVSDEMVAVLRKKTGAERIAMLDAMVRSARKMLTAHLSAEHPDWDEERVAREVASRISHGAV